MARIAASLDTLRAQVNGAFPGRDKSNDGWIGDARHQATVSDHNPNRAGVVQALDITNDPAHGCISDALAQALIASRDPRIKYVISNRRIAASVSIGDSPAWTWRPYAGSSPHDCHVHISVSDDPDLYDDPHPWDIGVVKLASEPRMFQNITATVFGGPGDENDSAYGGRVDPSKPGVALPWRFPGERPKVLVEKGGLSVVCDIVDVGPWNTNDPYWQTGSRPRAESGRDEFGRRPNRAGIDLTPAAARAIGLDGLGTVNWRFVDAKEAPSSPGLWDTLRSLFTK